MTSGADGFVNAETKAAFYHFKNNFQLRRDLQPHLVLPLDVEKAVELLGKAYPSPAVDLDVLLHFALLYPQKIQQVT